MHSLSRSTKAGILVGLLSISIPGVSLHAQDSGGMDLGSVSGALSGSGSLSGSGPEQLLQQLGIPVQQLQRLREQSSTGGVGNLQLQRLCASIAARHLSPAEVQSLGPSLGLSDDDVARLVDCARLSSGRSTGFGPPSESSRNLANRTEPPGPSPIEEQFHATDVPYKLLAAPDLSRLKQFGYELFSGRPADVEAFDNVPVGPDYIVEPGDELNILLWGRINRTLKLLVQRDGTVPIPQVGPLPVAGFSFAEAQKVISSQIGQIEGVQASVTMGRLRTINVFVIGQVDQPGPQTVSALAHVSDALTAAGGVQKSGSLRRIQLRRGSRVIANLDLYSMLFHGDASTDLRLEPRDVIFVPAIGPVVALAGNVRNPAIYELRSRETLVDVIRMAGGVSAFGYAQRIEVERVQNHQQRIAVDVGLGTAEARRFAVSDGDLIKVFTVMPEQRNVVKLDGNVNRPREYQWESGMRVADLIRQGQGIRDHTFLDYALLKRREGPTRSTHFVRVQLGDAISDESSIANMRLEPEDTLTVYSVGEIGETPTVSVQGEVRNPGTYPLTGGMQVRDLIYEAGGLKDNAYLDKAQLARIELDGSTARYLYESLNLRGALDGMGQDNVILQRGDEVLITQTSNWHRPWTVEVKGESMRPGPYAIHEGERLASLLERCGGIRPDGYLPALILIRQSVRKMQQQNLKRASAQLQTALTRAALMPAENKEQQPNLQEKAAALKMLKDMITQSGQEQAVGRIVLNPNSLAELPSSTSDIALEDHDEIIIPKRPSSVNVMGEVYGATAVAYNPALTITDYIDRAGGLTQDADTDQIFVVKANGAVVSQKAFRDGRKNRIFPMLPLVSAGLMGGYLGPGDTIYVPTKFLFVNPLQRTLDVTQIVANTAQGIAYAALLGTLLP
jgi:protein involved in polysaccharide export with SLBB domain